MQPGREGGRPERIIFDGGWKEGAQDWVGRAGPRSRCRVGGSLNLAHVLAVGRNEWALHRTGRLGLG